MKLQNQGDRIETFGLGETKYERKWIYLERRPRTWAPQNMGAPRTQGKVVQINSRFIETDKHETRAMPAGSRSSSKNC